MFINSLFQFLNNNISICNVKINIIFSKSFYLNVTIDIKLRSIMTTVSEGCPFALRIGQRAIWGRPRQS